MATGGRPQPNSSVYSRSLGQSWLALPAKTRLRLSLGICLVGVMGILASDYIEKNYPAASNNKSKETEAE